MDIDSPLEPTQKKIKTANDIDETPTEIITSIKPTAERSPETVSHNIRFSPDNPYVENPLPTQQRHSHVELQTKTHQTDQHDNVQQNGREKNAEHMTINRSGDLSKTISPGLEINDQLGEIENDPNNTAMEIESNATIEETNELQDDLPKKKSYSKALRNIRNEPTTRPRDRHELDKVE
ncbi:hypothetical protein C2G38_2171847 [Gigaspora rosea]|uniref:Uncharacterized protein n=1 Tax=Gigaspora rosea TaxID=44941 RepID=A0A397VN11_9GLOM|nr:hypothetical protein C2G38_2171847 [Gigaspora rosea]